MPDEIRRADDENEATPRTEARVSIEQIQSSSGPIPDPALLKAYDIVVPGLAERIVNRWEKQSDHRMALEKPSSKVIIKEPTGDYLAPPLFLWPSSECRVSWLCTTTKPLPQFWRALISQHSPEYLSTAPTHAKQNGTKSPKLWPSNQKIDRHRFAVIDVRDNGEVADIRLRHARGGQRSVLHALNLQSARGAEEPQDQTPEQSH